MNLFTKKNILMFLLSMIVFVAMFTTFILMNPFGFFDHMAIRERLENYEKPAKEYYASLAMAQHSMLLSFEEKDAEKKARIEQFVAACCKQARENHKKIIFESKHFRIYGAQEQSPPYEIDYLENLLRKQDSVTQNE